jgi:glutamine amidotransferase
MPRRGCTGWCASIRFAPSTLADEDLSVDFSSFTQPTDRIAVVATQPLTKDEPWQAMAPGTLLPFVNGAPHLS